MGLSSSSPQLNSPSFLISEEDYVHSKTHLNKHYMLSNETLMKIKYEDSLGNFIVLPKEIFFEVANYLTLEEILVLSQVSKSFFILGSDNFVWKKFYLEANWFCIPCDPSFRNSCYIQGTEKNSLTNVLEKTWCCWKAKYIGHYLHEEERTYRIEFKITNLEAKVNRLIAQKKTEEELEKRILKKKLFIIQAKLVFITLVCIVLLYFLFSSFIHLVEVFFWNVLSSPYSVFSSCLDYLFPCKQIMQCWYKPEIINQQSFLDKQEFVFLETETYWDMKNDSSDFPFTRCEKAKTTGFIFCILKALFLGFVYLLTWLVYNLSFWVGFGRMSYLLFNFNCTTVKTKYLNPLLGKYFNEEFALQEYHSKLAEIKRKYFQIDELNFQIENLKKLKLKRNRSTCLIS